MITRRSMLLAGAVLLLAGGRERALAQEVGQTADAAHGHAGQTGDVAPGAQDPGRHTYDMPPTYGATATVAPTHESERIGEYAQPRWTAFRRFPNTRVYVRPAGTFAFEYWLETKLDLSQLSNVRHRSDYEVEFGLGSRLQLDAYLETEQYGHWGVFALAREKLELRWAIANWGVIPLNPTLYAELVRQNEAPPKVEFKLLLGEQLASRLYFASNIVVEHTLGDTQENEYAITLALAYNVVDPHFSVGAEVKLEMVDANGARFGFDTWEVLAGPSFMWSPVGPMHILAVALFGSEHEAGADTPLFEPTVIFGWEI